MVYKNEVRNLYIVNVYVGERYQNGGIYSKKDIYKTQISHPEALPFLLVRSCSSGVAIAKKHL
jgi:hypothetical protein